MKKKFLSLSLILGLTFSASVNLTSCDEKNSDQQISKETKIQINTDEMKTDYIEGETFDPFGIVVTLASYENGKLVSEETLTEDRYELSIETGKKLTLDDKEVEVTLKNSEISSAKFALKVTKSKPTVLSRLESLQKSKGYKAIVSGNIKTRQYVPSPAGLPISKMVDNNVDKIFEFSPKGYFSSYTYLDIQSYEREISTYLVNLEKEVDGKLVPDGVAVYRTDPEKDDEVMLPFGSINVKTLKKYQETMFDFNTFLITDPDKPNLERLKKLDKPTYIFDLTVDSKGSPNNIYDTLNCQLLGKTVQLGSLADLISDIRLESTDKGLKYIIGISNVKGTYDTPVDGQIIIDIVETETYKIDSYYEQANLLRPKELVIDKDYARFIDMASKNSYSLILENEAQGTLPATIATLTYGFNYFAISIQNAETKEVLDGFIARINEDESITQGKFAPVTEEGTPSNPTTFLETDGETTEGEGEVAPEAPEEPEIEFQIVGTIKKDDLEKLGVHSPDDFLEIIAVSQTGGIGFLKSRPDFKPLGALFTAPLRDTFSGQPPCFITYDRFGYLGVNEYLDYTTSLMPISFTDPFKIAGSVIFWDEGSKTTIKDDKVRTGMLQNDKLAGWAPVYYQDFGVENVLVSMLDALEEQAQQQVEK